MIQLHSFEIQKKVVLIFGRSSTQFKVFKLHLLPSLRETAANFLTFLVVKAKRNFSTYPCRVENKKQLRTPTQTMIVLNCDIPSI